ncbi:MAG TPA: glycosyltransferase family 4 protein [Nitrospira sp.]|nr:glycosyltransferase family 4 protein [Nitrospira sp.]
MTWFFFCYWYEPDAPHDPVGLVRIWRLAEALSNVGDRVTIFPPRYRSAFAQRVCTVIPIRLIHLPLIRPLSYALLSFVRGLMQALVARPDIVYYRWMDSPHALILAKLLRVPCVCEVNGEPVPQWPVNQRRFVHEFKHLLAQLALKRCDRIVVLTEGLRALLQERYGVSLERIVVLPSGTDVERFAARDAVASRLELGLLPNRSYVGFVGSFYRYQGLACLLDAMMLVKRVCPSAELLLVGDGEATEELKQQAKGIGFDCSITWVGRVPYWEVPTWIGAMSVCVAPFHRDRGETSPVKLFDYLACHRPVVASAIPSVVSTFTADSGVQLVQPDDPRPLADAILALLNDPGRCARLGKQGRQFVEERFSWTAIVEQLRQWVGKDLGVIRHAHSHVL